MDKAALKSIVSDITTRGYPLGQWLLREPRTGDAWRLREAGLDTKSQQWLPMLPKVYPLEDAHSWIQDRKAEIARVMVDSVVDYPSLTFFVSSRTAPGQAYQGGVSLRFHPGSTADIGYLLHPQGRGKGIATAATQALCDIARQCRQERVILRIHPDNTASQGVAVRCGFSLQPDTTPSAVPDTTAVAPWPLDTWSLDLP